MLRRVIFAVAILGVMSCSALATVVPPGVGIAPPDVFGAPSGTLLANTGTVAFSYTTTAGTTSGTYDEIVIDDSSATAVCPSGGCLDFLLTVSNNASSVETLERITESSFVGFLTDVGYVGAAPGDVPDFVGRPLPGSTVGFNFVTTGIAPGATTTVLDIQTNAVGFTSGNVSLIDSGTFTGAGFAPTAVPEPGTLTLFGSGLIGLAGLLRRKIALL